MYKIFSSGYPLTILYPYYCTGFYSTILTWIFHVTGWKSMDAAELSLALLAWGHCKCSPSGQGNFCVSFRKTPATGLTSMEWMWKDCHSLQKFLRKIQRPSLMMYLAGSLKAFHSWKTSVTMLMLKIPCYLSKHNFLLFISFETLRWLLIIWMLYYVEFSRRLYLNLILYLLWMYGILLHLGAHLLVIVESEVF